MYKKTQLFFESYFKFCNIFQVNVIKKKCYAYFRCLLLAKGLVLSIFNVMLSKYMTNCYFELKPPQNETALLGSHIWSSSRKGPMMTMGKSSFNNAYISGLMHSYKNYE